MNYIIIFGNKLIEPKFLYNIYLLLSSLILTLGKATLNDLSKKIFLMAIPLKVGFWDHDFPCRILSKMSDIVSL